MPRQRAPRRKTVTHRLYVADSPDAAKRIAEVLRKCRGEYVYYVGGTDITIDYSGRMPKRMIAEWSQFIAGVLCADSMPVENVVKEKGETVYGNDGKSIKKPAFNWSTVNFT